MDRTNQNARPRPMKAVAISLVLASVLLERFTGLAAFQAMAIGGMAIAMAASVRQFGLREWYLGGLSVAATIALVLTDPAPGAAIIAGLDQAAFLMAFIWLLTMLHEAAATSPSISACGSYLTRQPPGRRFGALFWGTNGMAVLFNLGVVSLLTPLVQKGVAERKLEPELSEISERRQINALLRGFAFNVIWSPTALAPLAILELIDGIDRQRWTALGLALTALVFVAGWVEDRVTARRLLHGRIAARDAPAFPARAFGAFLFIVIALFSLVWGVSATTGQSIAAGLMLACPVIAFAWLWAQTGSPASGAAATGRLVAERLPRVAAVAATLAFSGYLGVACAGLIPAPEIAEALDLYGIPDWILLSILPLVLAALSWLGVSPIMLAVFFGSLFGALPETPTDPTLLALSISCGWAMSMLVSPFASVVMLLAQQTERSGVTVSLRRNYVYAAAVIPLMTAFFWWMTH